MNIFAGSYFNRVIILDKEFNVIDLIQRSYQKFKLYFPKHRYKDICVWEDSLYFSMFFRTGNWEINKI